MLHFVTVSRGFEPGRGSPRFKEVGNERYYENSDHLWDDDYFAEYGACNWTPWNRFPALKRASQILLCPPGKFRKSVFDNKKTLFSFEAIL
ncbi:predicted protein [Brucella ceti M644/93/1]|uniref:Uncharacterized protein n=1 Tax=Brucella ceti M644/93/1 TaxID=520459 RepID=A0ABM9Z9I0_9HYPH|nr:predicted protein [Brucella ceti M13/05/1]EEX96352.1 predicted protein [Brucella ceti M644/93/1]